MLIRSQDTAVLDFSRAFDTVPHERLLSKLDHYGIRRHIKDWIRLFLCDRQMWPYVGSRGWWNILQMQGGLMSATRDSLRPLLFLLFINDLPDQTSSGTTTRLFADDCLAYREIRPEEDQLIFQRDLEALDNWAVKWGMRFNPSKCNIMRIHRGRPSLSKSYDFRGEVLQDICTMQSTWAWLLMMTLGGALMWTTSQRSQETHWTSCDETSNTSAQGSQKRLPTSP